MRTIEATATIRPDRTLTVQVPPDITPGDHHIVVIIDEQPPVLQPRPPLQFAAYAVGLSTPERTLRREELYDDER